MTARSSLHKLKHKTRIRTRYRDAKKKAKTVGYIYRTNGMQGLSMYVRDGIEKRTRKPSPVNHAGDVLIITIDNDMLNHYRTEHMIETFESTGVEVGTVLYYDLRPEHIKRYNVFVFYRCPWMPEYKNIFEEIRRKNKVPVYAVDDLVVDKKYTDTLAVVQALNEEDRKVYDDGVERHGKLMKHCDYAITTTQALADELVKYKNLKEVHIDRNMRSDETIYHSDDALKKVIRDDSKVVIGYFSGTNTHNEDFQMVAPALTRILDKYSNVQIKLTGRIDAPEELKGYEDRLIFTPLVDWRRLPFEMRACHITLAPLVDSIFNRAKSELKWADSALVQVPIVASDMGASHDVVQNGKTGVLVDNTEDAWFDGIAQLVESEKLREKIGVQAREYVLENYRTSSPRAADLTKFIKKITPPVIAFGGVNIGALSGGNMIVKKHMDILQQAGSIVYGVENMGYHEDDKWLHLNREDDKKYDIFRVHSHRAVDKVKLSMAFDRFVATFWASVEMVDEYTHMNQGGKKLYLVQGLESGFYTGTDKIRRKAQATYYNHRLEPITISKWCQSWLKSDFERAAKYAPNGIDVNNFPYHERDLTKQQKIKVLIEGDNASEFKRVDASFEIANKLDREKYEVSYLSNNAEPKSWYEIDKSYVKVPYSEVSKIYSEHDILIKSSLLESFSYPPLEIMATGGVPVLVKNGGNEEYVKNGINALYYSNDDIDDALRKIETLVGDKEKFTQMAREGRRTAESRSWAGIESQIIDLYR
ncbi:glycosyltransferase [Candidatus Saccharibacteria bacterium]|nr:glycosyltransferase [Candidatus Saccharibacteria bacterium]